jgi:hypothetical protein
MKAEQGGRFEDDGGPQEPTPIKEPAEAPQKHSVSGSQIGRAMSGPLDHQELVLQDQVFGNDRSGTAAAKQSCQPCQKVHEQDDYFSHHQEDWVVLFSRARSTASTPLGNWPRTPSDSFFGLPGASRHCA